jgi:hypothetical protein
VVVVVIDVDPQFSFSSRECWRQTWGKKGRGEFFFFFFSSFFARAKRNKENKNTKRIKKRKKTVRNIFPIYSKPPIYLQIPKEIGACINWQWQYVQYWPPIFKVCELRICQSAKSGFD